METQKAGCFLIKKDTEEIAIIYREKQKDYSFPKGHVEKGEGYRECAIRETAEETKRKAVIVEKYPPYVYRYTTAMGEHCVCYMFIAIDDGKSDNTSEDTHDLVWVKVNDVLDLLSYDTLKKSWRAMLPKILEILKK